MKEWNGKRYHSLNYYLRNKFGEKVYKISLDGGFTCPNRDGKISKSGCLFCSERGSGDFAGDREFSINDQFNDIKKMMQKKWHEGKYIAYFLGQYQPHALCVLTADANDSKYTKEYFSTRYNVDEKNITFRVEPESPFTIQKIGIVLDVKTGNEYDFCGKQLNKKYLYYKSKPLV